MSLAETAEGLRVRAMVSLSFRVRDNFLDERCAVGNPAGSLQSIVSPPAPSLLLPGGHTIPVDGRASFRTAAPP